MIKNPNHCNSDNCMYIFGLLLSNVKVINIVIRHQKLKLIKILMKNYQLNNKMSLLLHPFSPVQNQHGHLYAKYAGATKYKIMKYCLHISTRNNFNTV